MLIVASKKVAAWLQKHKMPEKSKLGVTDTVDCARYEQTVLTRLRKRKLDQLREDFFEKGPDPKKPRPATTTA